MFGKRLLPSKDAHWRASLKSLVFCERLALKGTGHRVTSLVGPLMQPDQMLSSVLGFGRARPAMNGEQEAAIDSDPLAGLPAAGSDLGARKSQLHQDQPPEFVSI